MSLRDEVEKLIQAEQSKLEIRDGKQAEYHETQRARFAPIKQILEKITSPIDAKYIDRCISDDKARISLGYHSKDLHWTIEPDFEVRFSAASDESLFVAKEGFRLEEIRYHHDGGVLESRKEFGNEQALIEYLVNEIVREVTQYRRLEAMRAAKSRD